MAEGRRPKCPSTTSSAILVINCGSSSAKFALFAAEETLPRVWSGVIERVGLANARFRAVDGEGVTVIDETEDIADHDAALSLLLGSTKEAALKR